MAKPAPRTRPAPARGAVKNEGTKVSLTILIISIVVSLFIGGIVSAMLFSSKTAPIKNKPQQPTDVQKIVGKDMFKFQSDSAMYQMSISKVEIIDNGTIQDNKDPYYEKTKNMKRIAVVTYELQNLGGSFLNISDKNFIAYGGSSEILEPVEKFNLKARDTRISQDKRATLQIAYYMPTGTAMNLEFFNTPGDEFYVGTFELEGVVATSSNLREGDLVILKELIDRLFV